MYLIAPLLRVAERYARIRDIPMSVLSQELLGDSRALPRVQSGAGITVRNYCRVMEGLSVRWPAGVDWPDEVERPPVARQRKRAA